MASTTTSFLSLPLELRFMIYDLVMLSQPGPGRTRSYLYRDGKIEREQIGLDTTGCLFLANRKIYFEMEARLHTNPVKLVFAGEVSCGGDAAAAELGDFMQRNRWVGRNTRELGIRISAPAPEPLKSEAEDRLSSWEMERYHDVNEINFLKLKTPYLYPSFDKKEAQNLALDFWTAFSCVCYSLASLPLQSQTPPKPRSPSPVFLQPLLKTLTTFPHLETIELIWPSPSPPTTLASPDSAITDSIIWPTFYTDLLLLNSTSHSHKIKTTLTVPDDEGIVSLFRFLHNHNFAHENAEKGRLMMTSTWQYGENAFGERDIESGVWRRNGLDSSVRWESSWRVTKRRVGERGGVSVPVFVGGRGRVCVS